MDECSSTTTTSFSLQNKPKTSIYRFDLNLNGRRLDASTNLIIFRAVQMRALLFFKNYLEQMEYKSRKRWIGKIYEKVVGESQEVKAALRVSLRQLKIAQILGDPISIARCYLYISLGLAQDGHFKKAITTVRGIWKENIISLHSEFLKNCTLGVWMTIKWIKTREKTFLS
ncbi:unnamed protein product [Meloidogyne enterolobii]|uniref:Uncharacterized protein n=1 Tax=Meloidogyne enterolobii TaxID=390850 RepID=A0ACB1AJ54_MELEN